MVHLGPCEHEALVAQWQRAVDQLDRVDPYLRAAIRVPRVKVRWRIEPNHRSDAALDLEIATDQSCLAETLKQVEALQRAVASTET